MRDQLSNRPFSTWLTYSPIFIFLFFPSSDLDFLAKIFVKQEIKLVWPIFSAKAGLFLIFWRFQPQIVPKLFFTYFLIFPNSGLICPEQEKVQSKTYLLCAVVSSSMRYANKHETDNTTSANVTNLLASLPAPE